MTPFPINPGELEYLSLLSFFTFFKNLVCTAILVK